MNGIRKVYSLSEMLYVMMGKSFPTRNSSKNTTSSVTFFGILKFCQQFSAICVKKQDLLLLTANTNLKRTISYFFNLSLTVSISLLKMKSKDSYWLITNKSVIKVTAPRKWEYETQLMNLNWPCYFSKLKAICKETKLREFYYKSVHRIIATKKELYHFDIENNNDCLYCNESDSISHTFIDCYLSKSVFSHVLGWFNSEHASDLPIHSPLTENSYLENLTRQRSTSALWRDVKKVKLHVFCVVFLFVDVSCRVSLCTLWE